MTDNIEMMQQMHESRGYDRGFSAGVKHTHYLVNEHINALKSRRGVTEEDSCTGMKQVMDIQHQINLLQQIKLDIRKGYIESYE